MLVLDQLSRGDKQIRSFSIMILSGLLLLVAVLWHLQIFSSGKYVQRLESQAYRTVREPAVRGSIFDKEGRVLASSRPAYSISLYVKDLSKTGLFNEEYKRLKKMPENDKLTVTERSRVARFNVASNTIAELSRIVGVNLIIDEERFNRHYLQTRALPLHVMRDVSSEVLARFMESPVRPVGLGIETEAFRQYPLNSVGGHLLGFLVRRQIEEEDIPYSYQMPDYVGRVGVEGVFDKELRGLPGAKSVLVDNTGYRQEENRLIIPVAGQNVYLTIDAAVQKVAERALSEAKADVKGAVVVLDVTNGDILALASAPSYNPNYFIPQITSANWAIYNDENTMPTLCRASYGAYAPGSIFKIVVGLAALESGLDPDKTLYCEGSYQLGRRRIDDTAPAGDYNFRRAFLRSSNAYFISVGLDSGLNSLMEMGEKFFLGQKTGIPTMQEVSGFYPNSGFLEAQRKRGMPWTSGNTANLCLGQGDITVTPLQMAVMTAAIANGGTIYWPRLVMRLESWDPLNKLPGEVYPSGKVRGNLQASARNLKIIQDAMLADVEDREGTGSRARINEMRVCGKTGTAEVKQGNRLVRKDTWFVAYAPYESPRYAISVLVESGSSGGLTCAPIARKVFQELALIESNQRKAQS